MNRAANPPGYRLGSWQPTGPVTYSVIGPVTYSLTDSPRVRAIASRPDPSRPFQTNPALGEKYKLRNNKEKNGKNLFSFDAEVAREARIWAREATALDELRCTEGTARLAK